MQTKQYALMLKNAYEHLQEIKRCDLTHLNTDESLVVVAQKIRYFSVDMESALDYIAFDLFSSYFLPIMEKEGKRIESVEKKLRNVSFPNYKDEQIFNKRIKDIFPRLQKLYPEIFFSLKEMQPFRHSSDTNHWLTELNNLVNTNKHRHLSKTKITESANNLSFRDSNGNSFQIGSIKGATHAIEIGGQALTNKNSKSLGITEFKGNIVTKLVFSSDGKSVFETLENIYYNEKTAIEQLSYLIEKI